MNLGNLLYAQRLTMHYSEPGPRALVAIAAFRGPGR
jgi:hypothetical protein